MIQFGFMMPTAAFMMQRQTTTPSWRRDRSSSPDAVRKGETELGLAVGREEQEQKYEMNLR